MQHLNWVAGIILTVLGCWVLVKVNRKRSQVSTTQAFYKKEDVKFLGIYIIPSTIIISIILFFVTGEKWTLANIVTVFGGIFGTCAASYGIWKM